MGESSSNTWVTPGHFYSPLVDPADQRVLSVVQSMGVQELPPSEALAIDDRKMVAMFEEIASRYGLLPFPEVKTSGFRFYYENPAFSYGDAITYFGLLLEMKPKKVIEVGSGFSSCLLMDVNDLFFQSKIKTLFIEPFPELLLSLLAEDDPYRNCIHQACLQDVESSYFQALEQNDILFIDSSHVLKTASDVNDYLFRVFPILQKGVIIHIHDIPYPFEYGPAWILQENRSWNEAYAVRAFLQYNESFEILYFNHYMHRKHADLLAGIPLALRNCGASLWLRKVR